MRQFFAKIMNIGGITMKKTLLESILEVLNQAPDLIESYRETYHEEPDPFVLGVMVGTTICLQTFDKTEQDDFIESWTRFKSIIKPPAQ